MTGLGYYPVHFHHAHETGGKAYVKNNAIHHSFSRCVVCSYFIYVHHSMLKNAPLVCASPVIVLIFTQTVHNTHALLVEGNVAFDTYGHCYFIEDGIEERNVFDRNLGLLTRYAAYDSLLRHRSPAPCIFRRSLIAL